MGLIHTALTARVIIALANTRRIGRCEAGDVCAGLACGTQVWGASNADHARISMREVAAIRSSVLGTEPGPGASPAPTPCAGRRQKGTMLISAPKCHRGSHPLKSSGQNSARLDRFYVLSVTEGPTLPPGDVVPRGCKRGKPTGNMEQPKLHWLTRDCRISQITENTLTRGAAGRVHKDPRTLSGTQDYACRC